MANYALFEDAPEEAVNDATEEIEKALIVAAEIVKAVQNKYIVLGAIDTASREAVIEDLISKIG